MLCPDRLAGGAKLVDCDFEGQDGEAQS
jgi:hypothetical protein